MSRPVSLAKPRHLGLATLYWAVILYLTLPLVLMAIMALKDGSYVGLPIRKWTLKWFSQALSDGELREAFFYTLRVSLLSTLLAVVVGVWTALVLSRLKGWRRVALFALAMLPMIVPAIISAIGLRIFAQSLGLQPGTISLVVGLATTGVPFVVVTVSLRLASLPVSLIEAARDLGCDAFTAFLRITLPWIAPAVLAAALFCMLSGFDDFVRAIFLTGYEKTLPVHLYAKLTSGLSPLVPAIATLLILATLVVGIVAESVSRRTKGTL